MKMKMNANRKNIFKSKKIIRFNVVIMMIVLVYVFYDYLNGVSLFNEAPLNNAQLSNVKNHHQDLLHWKFKGRDVGSFDEDQSIFEKKTKTTIEKNLSNQLSEELSSMRDYFNSKYTKINAARNNEFIKDEETMALSSEEVKSQNEWWNYVSNFSTKPSTIVNTRNAQKYLEYSSVFNEALIECLSKDLCNMQPDSKSDPYFDYDDTIAHKFIQRNLEFIKQALIVDKKLTIGQDHSMSKITLNNDKINRALIDIYALNSQDSSAGELMNFESTQGKSRVYFLEKISQMPTYNRSDFLSYFEKTLRESDPFTVISLLENLEKIKISQFELETSFKGLCRFKDEGFDHNWKSIVVHAQKKMNDFVTICGGI